MTSTGPPRSPGLFTLWRNSKKLVKPGSPLHKPRWLPKPSLKCLLKQNSQQCVGAASQLHDPMILNFPGGLHPGLTLLRWQFARSGLGWAVQVRVKHPLHHWECQRYFFPLWEERQLSYVLVTTEKKLPKWSLWSMSVTVEWSTKERERIVWKRPDEMDLGRKEGRQPYRRRAQPSRQCSWTSLTEKKDVLKGTPVTAFVQNHSLLDCQNS